MGTIKITSFIGIVVLLLSACGNKDTSDMDLSELRRECELLRQDRAKALENNVEAQELIDNIFASVNSLSGRTASLERSLENNPVDVGLSVSLLNGLLNIKSDIALCVTGDQPTVSTKTFNNLINTIFNSENPQKTISVLRRIKVGKLDSAEGLGMPFAADRKELINYLKDKDDNLNPILREIFADGFDFYGVKENHPNELININHYSEYESIL